MLTAKHFRSLAELVAGYDREFSLHNCLAHDLADWAAALNPRFDRGRFLTAAGVHSCPRCKEPVTDNMGVPWCETCSKVARED